MDHIHEVEMFIFSHQFGFSVLPMGWWSNGEDGLTEESLKTMSRYRKITTICCAAVFALGLAACGGGDDGISTSERDAAVADAVAKERAMLQARIDELEERLGIEGENDPGDDVADLQAQIDDLEQKLKDKQDAEAEAADMANRAKLNKLAKGIGVAADDLSGTVTRASASRAKPKDAMDGDAPHAISGWNGSSYSTKTVTTVVYNDKAADSSSPFNKRFTISADDDATKGKVVLVAAMHGKLIDIPGLPTHASHDGVDIGSVNGVRGTLAGAGGTFTSQSGTVSVGISAEDGSPTWETGNLLFEPDSATATVMMPDSTYMNLGWWLTEEESGGDLTVKVAAWAKGAEYTNSNFDALIGKATFEGVAVGKYTHKSVNDINGGHFNADAMLVMDFDGADAGNLRGTIDNFMQDGESIGDGWKVELGLAATTAGDPSTFNPMTGAVMTATGVEDIPSGAMGTFGNQKTLGTWDAMFVDNTRNDGMPGGVTGQFHIGEASHPINMVGAFAASNMEADQPKK